MIMFIIRYCVDLPCLLFVDQKSGQLTILLVLFNIRIEFVLDITLEKSLQVIQALKRIS